jgi:hypothetical protein
MLLEHVRKASDEKRRHLAKITVTAVIRTHKLFVVMMVVSMIMVHQKQNHLSWSKLADLKREIKLHQPKRMPRFVENIRFYVK